MVNIKKIIAVTAVGIFLISSAANINFKANASQNLEDEYLYKILKTDAEKQFISDLTQKCDTVEKSDDTISEVTAVFTPSDSISVMNKDRTEELCEIFLNMHPEYFWISPKHKIEGSKRRGKYIFNVSIYVYPKYQSAAERKAAAEKIESEAKKFDSNLPNEKERVTAIYDKLIDSLQYDYKSDVADCQTISSALIDKKTVCAGYSRAFSFICRRNGIDAITVFSGKEKMNSEHEWNMVKVNGRWYCVDMTQDDTGAGKYKYFLNDYSTFQNGANGLHKISSIIYPVYYNLFPSTSQSDSGGSKTSSDEEGVVKDYPDSGILGDSNGDGKITSEDATLMLINFARGLVGKSQFLKLKTSDINKDGKIDANDATGDLIYYARVISGYEMPAIDVYFEK